MPSTTLAATSTIPARDTIELDGAPDGWEQAVAAVYGAACQPRADAMASVTPAPTPADQCPGPGRAAAAPMGDTLLTAATLGDDVIYGVGHPTGSGGFSFEVVAARLPSLGDQRGWYGIVPKIVAAIGSDARPGEDPNSARADSIHLLALDGAGHGGVVGVPRDAWVQISGIGRNKINASLSLGGPAAMLQTLADISGLNLDGYVLTGFTGFQEMVGNVLGGVDIDLPVAVVDRAAGANLTAGPQYLNGPQALSLARARKSLASGDLERQRNGGLLLLAALSGAQHWGPLHLPVLISESTPWLSTDLTAAELLAFSALALDTPLANIGNAVAPGQIGRAGSASVVYLSESAPVLFADLADGALTP
ncbi:MAG TPA: LCP family protein [Acidimicrobiia bacterium]|nr:LCP family protein [Acidimicrobiia bacterium]